MWDSGGDRNNFQDSYGKDMETRATVSTDGGSQSTKLSSVPTKAAIGLCEPNPNVTVSGDMAREEVTGIKGGHDGVAWSNRAGVLLR